MKVKFEIIVKRGNRRLATITGQPIEASIHTLEDAKRIIETEQFLERLTGCRFHINAAVDTETT